MAYLRKTARSPFWYLRYRDPETKRWLEENLKLRHDDAKQTLKARKEATRRSAIEAETRPDMGENLASWVPEFTRSHYRRESSSWRYMKVWETLHAFLLEKGIRHPREISYDHAEAYMAWRKGQGIAHNTARLEVKHLSFILQEAMRREFLDRNVIALARIPLAAAKEKPALSDDHIKKARLLFKKAEPWMGTVFEILIQTGCRFYEARIAKDRVDYTRKTLLLEDSKRDATDPRKWFTAPLSDDLAAVLKNATWYDGHTMPVDKVETNKAFNSILRKVARGATSHCCRVSFISRCHQAGLSEVQAMRLVNHSTRMVHRIYTRLGTNDAQSARERVLLPPIGMRGKRAPSAGSSSGRKKDTRLP